MVIATVRRAAGTAWSAATLPTRLAAGLVAPPRDDRSLAAEPQDAASGPNGLLGLVGAGASRVEDVIEEGVELVEDALGAHRRVWEDDERGHAQIEVPGIEDPAAIGLRHRLAAALTRFDGVEWAEVNAVTGRVAVAFSGGQPALAGLIDLIESVESTYGARRGGRARAGWHIGERAEHPADAEPVHRVVAIMAGDVLSLGWTAVGWMARAAHVPVEFAGAVSVIDNNPWLRLQVERLLGQPATALVLPLASAAANGLAQGPFSVLVDLGYQIVSLGEVRSRRHVWALREPEFYAIHSDEPIDPPDLPPRPVPFPDGPVERWGKRSAQLSLAGGGAAYVATRDARRAADAFLAGTPKAARLGREGFAAHLGRTLAYRGNLPLDGSALRRLDRIDTVVLDAEVMLSDRVHVRAVVAPDGTPADEAATRAAERLVDPTDIDRDRRRKPWRLAPFATIVEEQGRLPRGAKTRAAEIRRAGGTPMAVLEDGVLVAIADVGRDPEPGLEPVVDAVRRCGHRLLVAGDVGRIAERVGADGTLRGGGAMGDDVRALQAEGAAVMVIGRQGHRGLAAADVGLGVVTPTGRPSWGADLILGRELADAATIVAATRSAAAVSERSARLAMAGSALGALVTVAGPRAAAGSRGLAMVNGAAAAALVSGTWMAIKLAHEPRPTVPDRIGWHGLSPQRVLDVLEVDGAVGLSEQQARERRTVTGTAGLDVSPVEPFIAELANPLNPVLGAGAGLSAAFGSMTDAFLVLGLVGVNTAVGGVQRLRADRIVRQLLRADVEQVAVLRDGQERLVREDRLVRGDVLLLRTGDSVPADARIIEVDGCEVDESSLTGESLPVVKQADACPGTELPERACMLYDDTTIASGSVRAVVVATGEQTEVARSLALVGPPPPSGVELRLEELTRRLLPATLGTAAGTAGVGLLRRWPAADVAGTAVSLAIASVPEGLPFVATAGQLAGARRLAARGAVVRNPRTVEALGRVDVVCVDKTGTLTQGRVALTAISDGRNSSPIHRISDGRRAILAAALRASERPGDDTPLAQLDDTDRALHLAAEELGIAASDGAEGWRLVDELPFEASRGLHAVLGRTQGQHRLVVKGGPEVVLEASTSWRRGDEVIDLDGPTRDAILDHVDGLAARGHRLLAVAEREASERPEVEENRVERLCIVGLLVLSDPVRTTAAQAIQGIAEAGVRTIMLTGDHPETAISIASELGLHGGSVVTGADVDGLDDEALAAALEDAAVVARVTPAHKLRIVEVLQAHDHAVAMTGDGGNDAPAIRLADVGVAFGLRASPAARDAADIVIADDRIETLIDAIAEGRALWGSIREALAVLVGGNLGEIAFTTIASAFSSSAPLQARQFLLVNLFTDLAPAVAIAVRPPADVSAETLLHEGPEASLGEALRRDATIRGTATALGATAAWGAARLTGTSKRASTVGLVALVGTQLGQTVAAGGWRRPSTLLTAAGSAAGLAAVVQTPGVSRFFGSRPLGPVGWTQATTAATVATAGSQVASRIAARAERRATMAAIGTGSDGPADAGGRRPRKRSATDVGRAEDGTLDVLVTGATGFVGGSLVPRLLEAGHRVRVLVRDRERLTASWRGEVEVVVGRVEDAQAVLRAGDGCAAAYYLVHGLEGPVTGLTERERAAAAAFRDGAELAGINRIVYLGGLVDESQLSTTSEHLYARQQVGEELRAGEIPVTELRAGIVIGAGSASFDLLLAAARAPVAVRAPWSASMIQPIAAGDLLALLVEVLDDPRAASQVLDVGGRDVMSYHELVARVRACLGRGPAVNLPVPYLPPEATAAAAAALAGVDPAVTLSLLQSVKMDAVVRDDLAASLYPGYASTGLAAAIVAALSGESVAG